MIDLCLHYVDQRVRHEDYDIELMVAQRLGEIPAVSSEFSNSLQPALANPNLKEPMRKQDSSILGLTYTLSFPPTETT